jgi:hypothetical protein
MAWTVCAEAQPGPTSPPPPAVVLAERAGLRPELCGALRIQLSGLATVHCEPAGPEVPLPERIASAAARVRARQARLGIFLERDADPRLLRMYVVGLRADQAVLAVEPIEDRPDRDVDRSLALKVASSFERVGQTAEPGEQAAGTPADTMPLASALREDTAPPTHALAPSWQLFMEAGGGVRSGPQVAGLALLNLGVSHVTQRSRLELALGVELGTSYSARQGDLRVSARERTPLLSARALQRQNARFEWGAELRLACILLSAEGYAADGSRGERLLGVPTVGVGADLRVRLFASAFLRFNPGVDLPLVQQRLSVDGAVLVDYPTASWTLPLSVMFFLPLSPRAP